MYVQPYTFLRELHEKKMFWSFFPYVSWDLIALELFLWHDKVPLHTKGGTLLVNSGFFTQNVSHVHRSPVTLF